MALFFEAGAARCAQNRRCFIADALCRHALHKYLYANADGVNNSDPSGHMSLAEVQIGMVIVGTLNGMAINSAYNTLNQASDIFSPTGQVAEAIETIGRAMFVYEWLNYAAAGVGAGLLAKQGVAILWSKIAPKLPKAYDMLSKNADKIFRAGLSLSRKLEAQGRLEYMMITARGPKAVIGNFEGKDFGKFDYTSFADEIGAAKFEVPKDVWAALQREGKSMEENLRALDQFVAEGRTILISTPTRLQRLLNDDGTLTSFAQELEYLRTKYNLVPSWDGTRMVSNGNSQ